VVEPQRTVPRQILRQAGDECLANPVLREHLGPVLAARQWNDVPSVTQLTPLEREPVARVHHGRRREDLGQAGAAGAGRARRAATPESEGVEVIEPVVYL